MRSLPAEVKKATNACLSDHYPELVDNSEDKKTEGENTYGDVFMG